MYHYKCTVTNVVDGDTVDCVIDLGLRIFTSLRVRLYGLQAAELPSEEALSAKGHLHLLVVGKPLTVHTIKDKHDKYGRMLGVFYEQRSDVSVNQKMLDAGKAQPYMVKLTADGKLPDIRM